MLKFLCFAALCTVVSCQSYRYYPRIFGLEVPESQSYNRGGLDVDDEKIFMNEWTVEIDGGPEIAQLLALELGYEYGGEVLGFPGTYIFYKYEHSKQRRTPSRHTASLNKDRRVRWAEQMFSKTRVKRYPTEEPEKVLHRVKRIEKLTSPTDESDRQRTKRATSMFNDDLWSDEWYLQDTRTRADLPRLDLNVLPVYSMGINGSGVRVTVLDDGIEHNHTDLRDNYDPEISWDCNDRDSDPTPRYDHKQYNSHGTRCAGEIAMVANNRKCGVGVAWGAKIGGVRVLDGQVTDRLEGEAIGYAWHKVDIYSSSWGPDDNGATVEGPGRLAAEAFERGITRGRGGKGVIFVWANGNGGKNRDNCNCDGYASSIYTISVASASQHGLFPWYGEICSSTLATAYSSGAYKEQKIATTDVKDTCTLQHTGTSAAAPLAAGIIALALSANSNLTWRDVQHLIVWTSEYAPLSNNPGWQINDAGLRFDIRFGFGLLNAAALVKTALNWKNVPAKFICKLEPIMHNADNTMSTGKPQKISFRSPNTCTVKYVEHVELIVTLSYSRRGALEIHLTSPRGTTVPLLSVRPKDTSKEGFDAWPLVSVATWGENPDGQWLARILDEVNAKGDWQGSIQLWACTRTSENNFGEIKSLALHIHGTHEMPEHMKNGRVYNNEYNYNEVFDYYNKFGDSLNNDVSDLSTEINQSSNSMKNQLFRIHHRNPWMSE